MKKQKLYIKNEKGRYEDYKPERKTDDYDLCFRKINGKYVPCGRHERHEFVGEGVWVVLSNLSTCSIQCASGDYLKDLFQIHKVSEIEKVSIAQLGDLEKYYDYVVSEWNKYYKDYMLGHEWSPSNSDAIHFIIGKVFEYSKTHREQTPATGWIDANIDNPSLHADMCFNTFHGDTHTKRVIVRSSNGDIFVTDMRKEADGSFTWNVIPKSIVITHWMKLPNF